MRHIAHRGNIDGPDPELENHPDQLLYAINRGYEIEIDVRVIDRRIWLGHDEPQYEITQEQVIEFSRHAFWHCKNVYALNYFVQFGRRASFFWHNTDDYTITSSGEIWVYPGKPPAGYSIAVMPELWCKNNIELGSYIGICSDYIERYRHQCSKWLT